MSQNEPKSCCCKGASCQTGNAPAKPTSRYVIAGILSIAIWTVLYSQLEKLSQWLTYDLMGLARESHLGSAVQFFLFEVPKVLMLLALVVFAVGVIRSFFTPERTRQLLSGKSQWLGHAMASLLGVVTPFCSCSAVPLFIGFVTTGIPLGVTFSFLIAAPMVNEVALVLLAGLFGWKVAAIYLSTGLIIAFVAGAVIGRLKLERYIEDWVFEMPAELSGSEIALGWRDRIAYGLDSVRDIVGKVWIYILLGIAVGAGIHGYVPEGVLASIMGKDAWWSVPLAVVLGVPMYSNAAGIIPIVQALLGKGAALGTALAFMMSVIGLSLPEAIILRKVLKLPLIAAFFGVVAAGIVLVGYLFNWIL